MAKKDFSLLNYDEDGFIDKKLLQRCAFVCGGRWTPESLYNLFKMGEQSGTLEVALNHLGLCCEDLDEKEIDAASRVYRMARAKNLAIIQARLTENAGSAKEAQVLLESLYEITPKEQGIVNSDVANPVGILFEVKEPVGDIKITRGE